MLILGYALVTAVVALGGVCGWVTARQYRFSHELLTAYMTAVSGAITAASSAVRDAATPPVSPAATPPNAQGSYTDADLAQILAAYYPTTNDPTDISLPDGARESAEVVPAGAGWAAMGIDFRGEQLPDSVWGGLPGASIPNSRPTNSNGDTGGWG